MGKVKSPPEEAAELRRRAENKLQAAQTEFLPRTEHEMRRLLHELEVHRIELEIQNSELRQAREEMEGVLASYTDLYEFAPVGYFTLDHDGVVRALNLAGATLLGLERFRLLGRSFLSFVPPESGPGFGSLLGKVLGGRGKEVLELPMLREGEPLYVQIEAVADPTGRECRIAAIDITKRRLAEEELQRYREHLEELVRERGASLEGEIAERKRAERELKELNARLEQLVAERTDKLESTIRDLQTFSYSISHDLRTPLRSINSFAALLLEEFSDGMDQEGKRLLDSIVKRTVSMGTLIDDLLKFSKNSMQQLTVAPIDMTSLTEEIVGTLFSRKLDAIPEFRIAELPQAKGDRPMIAQVLENLLSNAVKFSRKAQKPVIEVGSIADDRESVYFVKDNGIGFDMKYIGAIFGVFQRLHGSDVFEGTGVGLAIVEQVITKHGGRVWAESKPGEGATFYFSLPKP
jgi:PAS domain S-box-containing protein